MLLYGVDTSLVPSVELVKKKNNKKQPHTKIRMAPSMVPSFVAT